ncbi:MAG TPA: thiolase family protein [Bacillales bacterium]|nr:thiolase family protein [Bacillales bacterium]
MNRDAVIVSAVRTPIARRAGALASLPAHKYGAVVVKEAIGRAGVAAEMIDDVIMGNVLSGGGNIARLTALEAGLSLDIAGMTLDRQCGSGISAIQVAAQAINAGDGDVYIAGGLESYSQAPFLMKRSSRAYPMRPPEFQKSFPLSPEEVGNPSMGITAENIAKQYHVSREEQDEFSFHSQQKMAQAMAEGRFDEQMVPIMVPQKKGEPRRFDTDEHPRPNSTMEDLAALPSAFLEDGTVTAGSSSGLNDAACALVVMSREKAEELGIKPMAVARERSVAGVDPNMMGIGPVPATRKILKKSGLTLDDFDLIEINEAFAAQVIACDRELHMDPAKVNVNGGAIAHGHPLGATGAILATKAIYELKRTEGRYALVTACVGGGQGVAMILERES